MPRHGTRFSPILWFCPRETLHQRPRSVSVLSSRKVSGKIASGLQATDYIAAPIRPMEQGGNRETLKSIKKAWPVVSSISCISESSACPDLRPLLTHPRRPRGPTSSWGSPPPISVTLFPASLRFLHLLFFLPLSAASSSCRFQCFFSRTELRTQGQLRIPKRKPQTTTARGRKKHRDPYSYRAA